MKHSRLLPLGCALLSLGSATAFAKQRYVCQAVCLGTDLQAHRIRNLSLRSSVHRRKAQAFEALDDKCRKIAQKFGFSESLLVTALSYQSGPTWEWGYETYTTEWSRDAYYLWFQGGGFSLRLETAGMESPGVCSLQSFDRDWVPPAEPMPGQPEGRG